MADVITTGAEKVWPDVVERILAARMVKGRRAEAVYLLLRPGAPATTVSILDELPPELGSDLLIENVALGAGQRCRLARDLMPLRRGTCELGPTYILWRSRLGLLKFRATSSASARARHAAKAASLNRCANTQRVTIRAISIGARARAPSDSAPCKSSGR